jgi:hypothetical protein
MREYKKEVITVVVLFMLVFISAIGTIEYANYVINSNLKSEKTVPYNY